MADYVPVEGQDDEKAMGACLDFVQRFPWPEMGERIWAEARNAALAGSEARERDWQATVSEQERVIAENGAAREKAEARERELAADLRIVFGLDGKGGFEMKPGQPVGATVKGRCRRCGNRSIAHLCPPQDEAKDRVLAALCWGCRGRA